MHLQLNLVENGLRSEALAQLPDVDFAIHVVHLKKPRGRLGGALVRWGWDQRRTSCW
jgi:hypothetical protein